MPPVVQNSVLTSGHIALLRYAVIGGLHSFFTKFNATIRVFNCNREIIVNRRGERDLQLPYRTKSTSSLSSSSNLEAITECSIHLKSWTGWRISLNITQMFLVGSSCTSGDVVSFYDSPYQTSAIFRQYCAPRNASDVNYVIMSSKNELFVTYKRNNFFPAARTRTSGQEVGIKFDVAAKYSGKF